MKKTISITGASSGIGKSTAKKFALAGWQLVLLRGEEQKNNDLSKLLQEKFHIPVHAFALDVRNMVPNVKYPEMFQSLK